MNFTLNALLTALIIASVIWAASALVVLLSFTFTLLLW
jgi:hypothetical protein